MINQPITKYHPTQGNLNRQNPQKGFLQDGIQSRPHCLSLWIQTHTWYSRNWKSSSSSLQNFFKASRLSSKPSFKRTGSMSGVSLELMKLAMATTANSAYNTIASLCIYNMTLPQSGHYEQLQKRHANIQLLYTLWQDSDSQEVGQWQHSFKNFPFYGKSLECSTL